LSTYADEEWEGELRSLILFSLQLVDFAGNNKPAVLRRIVAEVIDMMMVSFIIALVRFRGRLPAPVLCTMPLYDLYFATEIILETVCG